MMEQFEATQISGILVEIILKATSKQNKTKINKIKEKQETISFSLLYREIKEIRSEKHRKLTKMHKQ